MLLINRINTNPYFNIAAEEYVFRHIEEDTFMLWRSEPSLIIGKHQNPIQEINLAYAHEHHIPIIRRISGGGTVFHDLGNLNFSFTAKGEEGKLVDFKKYLHPIIQSLASLGIDTSITGKNNLSINGKKISGNAAHVYKQKSLHHGTLLFSANLSSLKQALKTTDARLKSNAVRSIPATTTNIQQHLPKQHANLDVISFQEAIKNTIQAYFPTVKMYDFSSKDIAEINQLVVDKYKKWEWNIGYSPKYSFNNQLVLKNHVLTLEMDVNKGIIEQIKISDPNQIKDFQSTENQIVNTPHSYAHITEILSKINQAYLLPLFF